MEAKRLRVAHLSRDRGVVVALIALTCAISFVGAAFAATHFHAGVLHGLESSTGGGLGAGVPRAVVNSGGCCNFVAAGVYHRRSDGGWNAAQCYVEAAWVTACNGTDWGAEPCAKYAWTQAVDSSGGIGIIYMNWHGWNSTSALCGGGHHT